MQKAAINLTKGGWAQAHHVSNATEWVLISGQVPQDAEGHVPEDITEQHQLVWDNLKTQLEAAGMGYENLIKLTIFLTDRKYAPEMVAVRSRILNDKVQPAVTTVIAGLFDARWHVEIEAIAAK